MPVNRSFAPLRMTVVRTLANAVNMELSARYVPRAQTAPGEK